MGAWRISATVALQYDRNERRSAIEPGGWTIGYEEDMGM
jgi:hypothetical protein